MGMLLRRSSPSYIFCDKLFMGSSRVHVLGLTSLVVVSLPFASHQALLILPCSLRKLRVIFSILHSMWMIFF